jgi:hypothetical protein
MVFAVAGLAGSAPPAVGKPLEATGVSQDPEGSGEVTTPAPPPDPVGDIDPVRPSEETGIQPLAVPVRSIRFPLASYSSYVDTFGACRDGCTRFHQGIDIFTPKLTPLIAARNGHVTWLRTDASGTAGNGVGITDRDGWRYLYLHANNDTPGTDDGRNPSRWRFISGLTIGSKVYAGQLIGYSGDSGNAEGTPPHLHFEIRTPEGVNINPYPSLRNAHWARAAPRLFRFDRLGPGSPDDHITWATDTTRRVLSCDVDGDGDDEPVFYAGNTFHISPSVTDTRVTSRLAYGITGDRGLCGDWDGNGTDTPGVRRGNQFLLRNTWTASVAQITFGYGRASDKEIVGDWNGDGVDTVGVFRGRTWLLANRLGGPADLRYDFGRAGDRPIPGDWDGNGTDTPAGRRGSDNYFRNSHGGGVAQWRYSGGQLTDAALVGHWSTGRTNGDTISFWRRYPT